MNKDEKFVFDIENLKVECAIENMFVTDDDVNMLRQYSNQEVSMNDMIENIKRSVL